MVLNFSQEILENMAELTNIDDGLEHGFMLYNKNNEIFMGKECVGEKTYIILDRKNYKNIIGSFHTHANSNILYPSFTDTVIESDNLICIGFNKFKKIMIYEKKIIYKKYINNILLNNYCKYEQLGYSIRNKYSYKNFNEDELNNIINEDYNYRKKVLCMAKNNVNLFHKYEIDVNTLKIKDIGY